MIRKSGTISGVAMLLFVAACDDSNSSDGPTAPTEWQGAETHLAAEGVVSGETVSFDLRGAAASDATRVFCERNYIVPDVADESSWDEGYLEKVEVKWLVEVDGEEREYQLELSSHDFVTSTDGATIAVVPFDEDDTQRIATRVMGVVQWQYEANGEEVEVEVGTETGRFVRGSFAGTPGADGVVIPDGQGNVGGYLHLTWVNGDVLDLSFTVPCGDNDLDIP